MLPRCSAISNDEPRDALTVLPLALPLPLARRIWGALPCDVRLRCREVCPAWRDALAEPPLWTELNLTSGVAARVTPALLLAAAARAGGRLERLCVTYNHGLHSALLAVVEANADTMRLLRLEPSGGAHCTGAAMDDLRPAPRQCLVEAGASGRHDLLELLELTRNEHDVHDLIHEQVLLLSNTFTHASLGCLTVL